MARYRNNKADTISRCIPCDL